MQVRATFERAPRGGTPGPVDVTVLVNAGPWLPVPPEGYGGIENVLATLVPELRALGVRVLLAAVGPSTLEVDELVPTLPEGRFAELAAPYPDAVGIAHAHMDRVVRELRDRSDVDLVHDHLEVVGPSVLAALGPAAPPALHTLHWDLGKHPEFYAAFDGGGRVWVNGVSASQLARAPAALGAHALGAVPLGVPLDAFVPAPEPGEHFLTLGRCCPLKGTATAARLCKELGVPLRMAGPVAGIGSPEELDRVLADPDSPAHRYRDVRYYLDEVRWLTDDERRWVGAVAGAERLQLLARARALLMPIRWAEPGATAVVESLACGTPVLGLRAGVLPSLVDHGVTGFLADDERELAGYMTRVDELDRVACRRVAEERFSARTMAERYVTLYREVLHRTALTTRAARAR